MRNGKTWAVVAGALLVTCALSSCTMPRTIAAFMGDERFLPEGAEVNFGKPHRPILNPINNYPAASEESSNAAPASHSSRSDNIVTASNNRRVPKENMAILSGKAEPETMMAGMESKPHNAMAMAAPVTAVDTALNDAPKQPAEPGKQIAEANISEPATDMGKPIVLMQPASEHPSEQAIASSLSEPAASPEIVPPTETASTAPVAAPALTEAPAAAASATAEPAAPVLKLIPPSSPRPGDESANVTAMKTLAAAPSAAEQQLATEITPAVASAETVMTKPAVDAVAASEELAPKEYPALANIPESPEPTPAAKIASDIQSLASDRAATQSAGQTLLSNQDSTVMTSPETGKLVANAATAMPALEPAAGAAPEPAQPKAAETSWLKNLLDPSVAQAEENVAAEVPPQAEASPVVASTAAPVTPAIVPPAATPAATEQAQDLTIPPAETAAPAEATPVAMEKLAPAADASAVAPVVLNEPAVAAAAAPSDATAVVAAAAAPVQDTVKLNPPVNVAEAVAVKADKELTDIVEQPVDAAEPKAVVKKVQYLPESRYAKKRLAPVNEAY